MPKGGKGEGKEFLRAALFSKIATSFVSFFGFSFLFCLSFHAGFSVQSRCSKPVPLLFLLSVLQQPALKVFPQRLDFITFLANFTTVSQITAFARSFLPFFTLQTFTLLVRALRQPIVYEISLTAVNFIERKKSRSTGRREVISICNFIEITNQ